MDNESKDRLTDMVQRATAEALASLTCPACGSGLSVQYTSRGKGALSIMCLKCLWRVVRDGITTEPPWVGELGQKVRTGAEPVVAPPRP